MTKTVNSLFCEAIHTTVIQDDVAPKKIQDKNCTSLCFSMDLLKLVYTKMCSFQFLTFLGEGHKSSERGVTYPQSKLVVHMKI